MKKEPLLIAVASQKGGVGKSVFTVLLASILHYGKVIGWVSWIATPPAQHCLMRERDIKSVMENDTLK